MKDPASADEAPRLQFPVEPWAVRVTALDLPGLAQAESVFALANGHIGMRGTFEEGEPRGIPGTYLNGFYEERPLPYAEAGYGYPEAGQSVIPVTDGKLIRLLVDDEPVDMRYGRADRHERVLDLRSGTLRRTTDWTSPTGRSVRITSERLVSFTQRSVAAISYTVEPLDGAVGVVLQSELLANEGMDETSRDPRAAAALSSPLVADLTAGSDHFAVLCHHARTSGLRLAAAMDHEITGPTGGYDATLHHEDDLARLTIATRVGSGDRLRIVKYLAYGWSSQRSIPALRDQVAAANAGARRTGWEGLVLDQRAFLDEFWDHADVEIDGDPELQQAVRFALFHTLQAGARGEQRAIPAKGLTGPGYDGHAFWDTETFVLPVLTYTMPGAAGDALRWRHTTLDLARDRAFELDQRGAAFPWRTIHGEECSAYWPAGTAAFHIGADVADAVARYLAATDDREFEEACGVELLVETARLWASLGHHDASGCFRISGVTGPDEYTAIVVDNVYTNLMAQRNLWEAVAAVGRRPEVAERLAVEAGEVAQWQRAADAVTLPFDELLGVHQQSAGFTELAEWDFAAMTPDDYPLLLHFPYFDLYRKQVVKQADLVMAMYLRGDAFTAEQKARNFAYYEARTVRDSSLSASIQSIVAAEVGHLDLALDYFAEATLTDLHDLHHNTRNGLHIASLAGAWLAAVAGFGGMRDHSGALSFAPRLPDALTRLTFRMRFRSRRLHVEVGPETATYTLVEGEPLDAHHHGEAFTFSSDAPVTLPVAPGPELERPTQPPGRAPARRVPVS